MTIGVAEGSTEAGIGHLFVAASFHGAAVANNFGLVIAV